MSTFQAVIYAIVHGFTEFLPVSPSAHRTLVPYLLGWPEPAGALHGALSLGALLAVLIYLRHDWASAISGFLSMVLFRKKPRVLDEWLGIFLICSTLPVALGWYYLANLINDVNWAPWLVAIVLAASGLFLLFCESIGRRNKGMFDWNGFDAFFVGILQIGTFIPGFGRMLGAICGGMARNYSKEATVKYALFASAPILAASTYLHLQGIEFHSHAPSDDLSWLSFVVAVLVTLFSGLLAIGGLMKQIERKGFAPYAVYRILLAVIVGGVYWLRSRG